MKTERDDDEVTGTLKELEARTAADDNMMPAVINAIKMYATMGEIMGVFEDHYGAYQERIGLA